MGEGLEQRDVRVVVAGKVPPPVGGQNLNVERFLRLLGEIEGIEALYWEWGFTKEWGTGRRGGIGKMVEFFRVLGRLVKLRMGGRLDYILYSTGGPHTVPIVRDLFLLPVACLFGRRVCVHFQAAGIARRLGELPGWMGWMLKLVHRPCYGAVVLTEFGRVDAEALGFGRIDVIGNAVEDERSEVERQGIGEVPRILNVGHLCVDKGTPGLIAACGDLRRKGYDFFLDLVGECLPPYTRERLGEDLAEAGLEGGVECPGVLRGEELGAVWGRGDLFVFSTVAPYESFGLVLVEAMRAGLPVVVTDWRANAEVFGAGEGGGGILVSGDEDVPLARRLGAALEEALEKRGEWGRWGEMNRERYEARYSIGVLRDNLRRYFLGEGGVV
ncbi:MAG: glycosyltransferase family 4 protein [Verrucomicrobiota bacterium]